MSDGWLVLLTVATAIGCGLTGGVFFAFSTFIMKGLGRVPAERGMAAMQGINVAAITPAFMTALFGTALSCIALGVVALADWRSPRSTFMLGAAVLYVGGVVVVTVVCNVPRNDALAAADPASPEGARVWADYLVTWTQWNHVRTASALVAAALLISALLST